MLHVLLHQQDRHALGVDAADDGEGVLHQDRRQPEARLVEHQEPRLRHQRAADHQHLLLAAGERAGRLRRALASAAGTDRRRAPVAPDRFLFLRASRRRASGCPACSCCGKISRPSGTCTRPRATRRSGLSAVMSSPSNRMRPRAAGTRPEMQFSVVVLPAPLAPSRQAISPCANAQADVLQRAHRAIGGMQARRPQACAASVPR